LLLNCVANGRLDSGNGVIDFRYESVLYRVNNGRR
jgi:hypothetical protein